MHWVLPRETLEEWADGVGLSIEASAWDGLAALVGLWQRYGKAFNLVGDLTTAALHEHIREGLMAVRVAELAGARDGVWLDIGSGGGVPGLIVAAVRSPAVLVEPRERRAAFLKLAAGTLKYTETTVVRARVVGTTWEKMALSESFDPKSARIGVVGAKAVMPLDQWLLQGRQLAPDALVIGHATCSAVEALGVSPQFKLVWGERIVFGVRGPET